MTVIINVARKRVGNRPPEHIFRTARDSIYEKSKACAVARSLAKAFPPEEFEITVSAEAVYSEYLDWEQETAR